LIILRQGGSAYDIRDRLQSPSDEQRPPMPVNIHATEKPLHKIFCNDFLFSIPPYQRPYAWTTEQANELLTDFLAFLGDDAKPIDEVNPYFLGSIVLIKAAEQPNADVVDGQQRLTTLTILLAVLRTVVADKFVTGVQRYLYEDGDEILGTPNRYRLKLRQRDADFFQKYVQDENGINDLFHLNSAQLQDTERNMQSNAKYFRDELLTLPETQRGRLLQYMMTRCYLVVVSTPDLDSAYRIFSVLNTRGMDLGITDLLKAEIIGKIPEKHQAKYNSIWEDEEEDLGRETFQELFAHIRMIFRKAKLRETALNEYRKFILPTLKSEQFIENVLKPYSDALEIIKCESYQSDKGAEAVNSMFRWLNQIDNFDWLPSAILYLSKHLHQPVKLKTFFTDLERLAAGLMVMRADINYRIERYGQLLTAIESDADLYAEESPLQLTLDETKQIVLTLRGDLYTMKRIRQYVLLRLDAALSQGEAQYDFPVISVEHILPQNPKAGSKWLEWFDDEEVRLDTVHKIGNLALLSRRKNAEAQNYEFAKKKEKYFTSGNGVSAFAITTQVLQQKEWTPEIVEERQTALISKLRFVWRLGVKDGELITLQLRRRQRG
jgi:uncharacterized protein with ParB-like and HNH nuclease domain